ncbi:RcpC/CpaB family pilus assembly protein [Streptomyces montanisoli]|uniref:RcpC/CpaB family pilus assembly protein n=1 Tax=Streptomyces montanisoli TaxID=2798581 RepID=UPI0027DB6DFD|nr:RcpC/CpaB family pilus assembly protein [Streptomyces montanisoli]
MRIADAATVRLLRPGDHVDVIATPVSAAGTVGGAHPEPRAHVVAARARVAEIPEAGEDSAVEGGALLVLSVPRATATALAGAASVSQLAVTLC